MRKVSLLAFLIGIAAAFGFSQERFVKPVDEGSQEPSFLAFRTKLVAAAERKDLKYVKSIMDPKIHLSYGGHVGKDGFKELWKNEAEFWVEFLPVIKNGGRFVGEGRNKMNVFAAPYLFLDMPEDLDQFEYFAVFGNNVNLREKPDPTAPVITQLSYNIVKADESVATKRKTGPREHDWKYDWHEIETLGGIKGWMKAEFVRSPVDYRAGFEKKRGKWVMTFFLAGD